MLFDVIRNQVSIRLSAVEYRRTPNTKFNGLKGLSETMKIIGTHLEISYLVKIVNE